MTVIDSAASQSRGRPIRNSIARWLRSAQAVFATCLHYYQAAAMYEELRKLPPAELERRGFSRGNLARDLCGLDDRAPSSRTRS